MAELHQQSEMANEPKSGAITEDEKGPSDGSTAQARESAARDAFEAENAPLPADLGAGDQDVAKLFASVAKTARSFLFYDAHNEAILHFLQELKVNLDRVLSANEELAITVWPFELWFEERCVYVNREREQSLAFRLFRDGVRRLIFRQNFSDQELGKFLEALSVRYTGVHQNEDDMVTLLWRANFEHLEIVAVDGLVLDDDEANFGQGTQPSHFGGVEKKSALPEDVDLPAPELTLVDPVSWMDVSPEAMGALEAEAGSASLSADCISLFMSLCEVLENPAEQVQFSEIAHSLEELLVFLLSPRTLIDFHWALDRLDVLSEQTNPPWDKGRSFHIKKMQDQLTSDDSLKHLIRAATLEKDALIPDVAKALSRLSLEPVWSVISLFEGDTSAKMRSLRRKLLTVFGQQDINHLKIHFKELFGPVCLDLFNAIVEVGGESESQFVAEQLSHGEQQIRERALHLLTTFTFNAAIGKQIFFAFRKGPTDLRRSLLPHMESSKDTRFLVPLEQYLQGAYGTPDLDDCLAVGRVMGLIGGDKSRETWEERLTPKGFFRRHLPGSHAEQVAAAGAIATFSGQAVMDLLVEAMRRAEEDIQPFIGRSLARMGRSANQGGSNGA